MSFKSLLTFVGQPESIPSDMSTRPLPYIIASLVAVIAALYLRTSSTGIPVLNQKKSFRFGSSNANEDWAKNARRMLGQWFDVHPDTPVGVIADSGPITILPPHMANEIRNDQRLSFVQFTAKMFHAHLPGFEVFGQGRKDQNVVQRVVVKNLTKQLNKVTEPLAEETSLALSDLFSDTSEWHQIPLRQTVLRLIARISSRVFLGEELCRNEDWLKVTREYTITSFKAAQRLRLWPAITRPIVNWVLPECRDNRLLVKEARRVMEPVLKRRQNLKAEARAKGEQLQAFNDAIEWFEDESRGEYYDPSMVQLAVSLAAIHTTSDLTCQALTDIAQHPEMLEPLRNEIVSILRQDGWQKTSLYKMKLLDSVIKESQRLKPIAMTSMTRVALEKVVLSDGTVIPKGRSVGVSSHSMWDPELYDRAQEWDGYRFYNMRESPEKQHLAQLVTTSPEHLAFGHGLHACPGRFFAANEVKMALATILLKYDFKLLDGITPKVFEYGFSMSTDPFVDIRVRRREEAVKF